MAASYGQPWGSHSRDHDFKVTGSVDRTIASLSATSLNDHPSYSGEAVPKSKEWILLDDTQKHSSKYRHSSKFVATPAIQKQWSYDEQATRPVDLPSKHTVSSEHTYMQNTCMGATGKSLSQLHSDGAASSDTSHNNERERISSRIVISKGLSCSELISTKPEMPFGDLALSAELLDIESNNLSSTDHNEQISSEVSASSTDFINGRHITRSDSSSHEVYGNSRKICIEEAASTGDKPVTCHDFQQIAYSSESSELGGDVPCSDYSEYGTNLSVLEHITGDTKQIEPETVSQSTEHTAIVEHVSSHSNLLTSELFTTDKEDIADISKIPCENDILEEVTCDSHMVDNTVQPNKEHVATSTEQPKSENVATLTDQPKSENVATSTEQLRREHVATSTRRTKKEHVATSTEEPRSEHVATSTERPRSRSIATSTDEPFIDVATCTEVIHSKHAATSIQTSFEEQDTGVTLVESGTQMPSEEHFQNQTSRTPSIDLPYVDHILADSSHLVISTSMTLNEATVTGTDQSELDEETEDSSLQELESSSDELPSTGQTSCFPF